MHLTFRNVNEAFRELVGKIDSGEIPTVVSSSRVGEVMMVEEPVIVTYTRPRERVLFNSVRDCNPFFHLFESLWMLAGRNDVEPLAFYNPKMRDYSDDGKRLHGAYGYRWRNDFVFDQLETIVACLKVNPTCRRQVLEMWKPVIDLDRDVKDVPCNTHAYFSIRNKRLDMTVCNRSNDLIWGMLGANVVHFSMLQEYMACCIGVEVGVYNQMTNNLHVYTDNWKPKEWLADCTNRTIFYPECTTSLVKDPEMFDAECRIIGSGELHYVFQEPFLKSVAQPMLAAFRCHKQRKYWGDNSSATHINHVWADDWRIAGTNWINKRQKGWETRV